MNNFDLYIERAYLEELPEKTIKSYAFDWDDNIQFLPTKIKLRDFNNNLIKDFSTEEFAIERNNPEISNKIESGEYEWDFSSFRNDEEFFQDVKKATPGPSWNDFVECLNHGFLFAIITARGHSINAYKKVIYDMIISNQDGISKDQVVESIKEFRGAVGHNIQLNDERIIKKYINQGRYYPVSNPEVQSILGASGGASSPEKLKVKALMDFRGYVNIMGGVLVKKIGDREITVGFSDDDKKNYMTMKRATEKEGMDNVVLKYTGKENNLN